jgi:uncharacterized small protein (DUF1192 family)
MTVRLVPLRRLIDQLTPHPNKENLKAWRESVLEMYSDMSKLLPQEKRDAEMQRIRAESDQNENPFASIAERLGLKNLRIGRVEEDVEFVSVLALTHGIGLLQQTISRLRNKPYEDGHGQYAATAFRLIVDLPDPNDPDPAAQKSLRSWEPILFVLTHRTDATMPKQEEYPNQELFEDTRSLLGILRGIVIRDRFQTQRVLPKLQDALTKEQIRKEIWSAEQRERNPLLGREQGVIARSSQMMRFEEHMPLQRAEFESYETVMLEQLSELFGLIHHAMIDIVVEEGGPSAIYGYLRDRLRNPDTQSGGPSPQMLRIKESLTNWNRIAADRIISNAPASQSVRG